MDAKPHVSFLSELSAVSSSLISRPWFLTFFSCTLLLRWQFLVYTLCCIMVYRFLFVAWYWSLWAHLHVVGMSRFMSDINQPSLPTPFYSVSVSVSVFMAHSTVFHSINSPNNSLFSHSVLAVLSLPYWSFQLYISLWKSPSALIQSLEVDWAQNTNELTNLLAWYCSV